MYMVTALYIFLPMVIFVGIISSYTDIKYKKIGNRLIMSGIAYAFFLNIFLASYSLLKGSIQAHIIINHYLNYILNSLAALIVSFFMWRSGIWNAGDAKLFIVFVFLLPLSVYSRSYIDFFPAIALLMNIFVPFSLFFIGKLILFSSAYIKKEMLKKIKKNFFIELLIVIGISGGLSYLSKTIADTLGIVQNTAFTIIAYFFIRRIVSGRMSYFRRRYNHRVTLFVLLTLLVVALLMFFNIGNAQSMVIRLKSLISLVFAFIIFRIFSIAGESKTKPNFKADGVNKKDLEVPFAPAIFIGVLLTIVNKGFFYNIILALFV